MITPEEGQARAARALRAARQMTPQVNGFAKMLTRNDNVEVVWDDGSPRTDGKRIYLRPPIQLGDELNHGRKDECRVRDIDDVLLCEACRAREDVLIVLYHEVAHIAFDSFEAISDADKTRLVELAVRAAGAGDNSTRAAKIAARLDALPVRNYAEAAHAVSPFLHPIVNALEDVRVNLAMYRARPGTFPMFRGHTNRIFNEGMEQADGTIVKWSDMPANSQMIVGLFCKAAHYDYSEWFHPEVVEALDDADLSALVGRMNGISGIADVYRLAFPILEEVRRLGFCKHEDDPEDDPKPEPKPEPAPPKEADPDTEDTDGDSDDEGDQGNGGESDESDKDSDDTEAGDSDADSADADGQDDEDGDGANSEDGTEGDNGEESSNEDGDAPDENGNDPENGEDAEGDTDSEGDDAEGDADSDDDTEDESGSDSEGVGTEGDDADTDADFDNEDDDDTDDDTKEGDDAPGKDPGSTFKDEDAGTPAEVEQALKSFGGHQDTEKDFQAEQDEKFIEQAIRQEAFDSPSDGCAGVRLHYYGKPVTDPYNSAQNMSFSWPQDAYTRAAVKREVATSGVSEGVIATALLRTRRLFADNKAAKITGNLTRGRVNARVLGRRLPTNDDRLFAKKSKPTKKDYFVVLGLDVSGSTADGALITIRNAALAQAELLARVGVPFAIYAHTGNHRTLEYNKRDYGPNGKMQVTVEIYVVKEAHEAWTDAVKERLIALQPSSANVDGHTLEFYRKVCDQQRATDKVIMYYTDGAMPAMNPKEELVVLQREIATCKQRGYTLMGVGVGTDSPVQHGLDTVVINHSDDVPRVVAHLEKRLLNG